MIREAMLSHRFLSAANQELEGNICHLVAVTVVAVVRTVEQGEAAL